MSVSGFELLTMSASECHYACEKLRREQSMNTSGWNPVEFNCVVRMDKVEEKTPGGVYLPDQKRDEDKLSAVEALLVAVSPLAFTYEEWPAGTRKPEPGDRVLMAKYAGSSIGMSDFRIIKDKDILAVRNSA